MQDAPLVCHPQHPSQPQPQRSSSLPDLKAFGLISRSPPPQCPQSSSTRKRAAPVPAEQALALAQVALMQRPQAATPRLCRSSLTAP